MRAGYCKQDFDTQKNCHVGGNPAGVFIEAADSPGMKKLYSKSAKHGAEQYDAVRPRREKSVETAQSVKRDVPMLGFKMVFVHRASKY